MRSLRATAGALSVALIWAGLLGTPARAEPAADPAATPYFPAVHETPLGFGHKTDLVVAGDRLFVTDVLGGRLLVLREDGSQIAALQPFQSPRSMVVSPDGGLVYLAGHDAGAIVAVDVATADVVSRYEVGGCPEGVAISSGRLFFSYGCSTGQAKVGSIDPAAPGPPVVASSGYVTPPKIRGTAGTLVVSGRLGSNVLSSFATASDGSVTPTAVAPIELGLAYVGDMELSADGSRLLVAAGAPSQATALTVPELAPAGTYPGALGEATAVAMSPDGTRVLLGGTDGASALRLFDATSRSLLWHRYAVLGRFNYGDGWAYADRLISSPAVAFSSDGMTVYALTSESNGGGVSLFRSPLTFTSTRTYLGLDATYGRPVIGSATVNGATSGSAQFASREEEDYRSLGSAPLVNGTATKTLALKTPGEIEAYYVGDYTHAPSVSPRTVFRPATRVSIAMVGTNSVRKHVHKYATYADVRARIRLEPGDDARLLHTALWKWRKGKWRLQGTSKLRTDGKGKLVLVLSRPAKGKLCFTAWYPGDSKHAESGASGAAFTMAK